MQHVPFYKSDPWLYNFSQTIKVWHEKYNAKRDELCTNNSLIDFASGHLYYGDHLDENYQVIREWAPNATEIFLVGTVNDWKENIEFKFNRINTEGDWELKLDLKTMPPNSLYKLLIKWDGGEGLRLPSYARRVVQDNETKIFSAQSHPENHEYKWINNHKSLSEDTPIIYEAHIGMSSEKEEVSSYTEFRENILPHIAKSGYNTIQLMAIQEHPYYGSFGYHVSNFFAVSSRFGTPDEFKKLVDAAHGLGIKVIMDLVHSHSVRNSEEGIGLFAGDQGQYFHAGERGLHSAWDSLCFDYGNNHVIHFLLSNCRYWIEEYHLDGFRFDGITSMLYYDHGLNKDFTEYSMYFNGNQDIDAIVYLKLANSLIHELKPGAISIAEEMSGMPGVAASIEELGLGFDFRLNMGAPDFWIKTIKEKKDEDWDVNQLFFEMSRHRVEERIITYCESHDQALVGDKTLMFRLADAEMYTGMDINCSSLVIDRAIALHKMIRLFTLATGQGAYLNFMGNEFGHPDWIDFPREGNTWSYKYARRQWSLADNPALKYKYLLEFDRAMISMVKKIHFSQSGGPEKIYSSTNDSVISYSQGEHIFVFNFHPVNSFTDYHIPVSGRFRVVLNTDENEFGGQNRIDSGLLYISIRPKDSHLSMPPSLPLYLPARTAIVLKSEPIRRINQST